MAEAPASGRSEADEHDEGHQEQPLQPEPEQHELPPAAVVGALVLALLAVLVALTLALQASHLNNPPVRPPVF